MKPRKPLICLLFIWGMWSVATPSGAAALLVEDVIYSEPACPEHETWSEDLEVRRSIDRLTRTGKREMELLMGKLFFYQPIFETYFAARGLPVELTYLPIVESGLRHEVVSSAGAGGLWQFMPATGRYYGLEISAAKDERTDVFLSTRAATEMLAALQEQFCNWTLALAAYNCGPGRVRRAIEKAGTADYQAVRHYLPKQTRQYIAKFIAVVQVLEFASDYQLEPNYRSAFEELETVLALDRADLERALPAKPVEAEQPTGQSGLPLCLNDLHPMKLRCAGQASSGVPAQWVSAAPAPFHRGKSGEKPGLPKQEPLFAVITRPVLM